jgi:hypothetical protein
MSYICNAETLCVICHAFSPRPNKTQVEKEKLQKHREYQRKYQREWQRRRKETKTIGKIEREKVI